MKRLFLLPLLGGIFLASCHKSAPRAEMKTDVDTLSYEIGMANTQGIEAYFRQMGIDSQYVDDFIRGLKDARWPATIRNKWLTMPACKPDCR